MTSGIFIDLTGERFGKLLVLAKSERRGPKNQLRWTCRCDCGRQCDPYGYSLRNGATTSCGCGRIGGYTATNGRQMLTQERLKELLHYDPETGLFRWRIKPSRTAEIDDVAGNIHVDGYRVIGIDGKIYRAARLAWLYIHGAFPKGLIDHKSGDRSDDRICNLRPATAAENARNAPEKSTRPGHLKGAYLNKKTGRWFSAIRVNHKSRRLGTFATREEAHAAYCRAAQELHGEFAREGGRHPLYFSRIRDPRGV